MTQNIPIHVQNHYEDKSSFFGWLWDDEDEEDKNPCNLDDVLGLAERLKNRIIDQDEAVEVTADAVIRYAVGLNEPNTPIATLFYIGPTGVGKTELAKELTKELLGSVEPLIFINMSEYRFEHDIWRLTGSGNGYLDSHKGGLLTNAILRHPHSVMVLDEFDKAHPQMQKLFLGLFDEGKINSGTGRVVDCSNTIFILTSNYCAQEILTLSAQEMELEEILDVINIKVMKVISPELYNRVTPVIFKPLSYKTFDKIVTKMLTDLQARIFKVRQITLLFDPTLIEYLRKEGYSQLLGARPLKRLIQKDLTTFISRQILKGNIEKGDMVNISYRDNKLETVKFSGIN